MTIFAQEVSKLLESNGAPALLSRLKELRDFTGQTADFWERYVVLAAFTCRAPFAVVIEVNDSGVWEVIPGSEYSDGIPAADVFSGLSLDQLAARSLQNGFAYERIAHELSGLKQPHLLVLALEGWQTDVSSTCCLCMALEKSSPQIFNDLIVRAELITDIPRAFFCRSAALSPSAIVPQSVEAGLLAHITDGTHAVMRQQHFETACSTLVHELAYRFDCIGVSLGWMKGGYLRPVAVSHIEEFSKDSTAATRLESLYEEAADHGHILAWPSQDEGFAVNRFHREYVHAHALAQIVSFPMMFDGKLIAVVVTEYKNEQLTDSRRNSMALMLEIVAPWLSELEYRDSWAGKRILTRVRKSFAALTRGEHLGGKIFAAFCGLLVLLSFVITLDYRVEGVATLSTDQVRYVSAPFDGVISDVFVREGDAVRKGDGLAKLDTRELQLKKSQESADIVRYTREAEKSRAANALADMKIAQSRMEEVVCELKRTDYAIEQATITAQSDGVIVEGDSKKLLGSPVAKGDVLMKVARIEGIYILIKINERDLDQIRQGMQGEMMLVSQPDTTFPIVVDKVIPMAEVDQREGNVFVLKAHVNGAVRSWWRPGMSGVAKIDAGKRSIAWLLSHRIIDYLRMKLWW